MKAERNQIELNLEDIKPYENNPRKNDGAVDAIARSIEQFGFNQPIVIDRNNIIVAGHTRHKAAKKLGLKTVPCIRVEDLTDEEVKAYRLADNKTAELAGWDFEMLAEELQEIDDIDMSDFGFEEALLSETEEVVEDEVPEINNDEPTSKPGDIWRLGPHVLMCGDSTNHDDVKKLIGGISADLLLTDPPYNIDYTELAASRAKFKPCKRIKEGKYTNIKNDKLSPEAFEAFLTRAFHNASESMKKGAAFYIWHSDLTTMPFRKACLETDLDIKQCLIWEKQSITLTRQDYQWQHEPCLYGWKKGASHSWYSDRRQRTILKFDKPQKSELHPTMKPVALFDYLIKNSTKQGDIVLDLFGGSGTTLIACEQNGRVGYLMELDPKYCDVIVERWEKLTGRKAVLDNGN